MQVSIHCSVITEADLLEGGGGGGVQSELQKIKRQTKENMSADIGGSSVSVRRRIYLQNQEGFVFTARPLLLDLCRLASNNKQ